MITTKIIGKSFVNGALNIQVSYSGDFDTFSEEYQVSNIAELENRIKVRVRQLEEISTYKGAIAVGDYALPVAVPTQDEADKVQFLKDLSNWRTVRGLIDLGILTGNEEDVVLLFEKVKRGYKPEHLDLV